METIRAIIGSTVSWTYFLIADAAWSNDIDCVDYQYLFAESWHWQQWSGGYGPWRYK